MMCASHLLLEIKTKQCTYLKRKNYKLYWVSKTKQNKNTKQTNCYQILIAPNGYCKLVDFGFAKKRDNSCTICGTLQYLAPEVIQNYAHGFTVDWWTLGIFIYEMVLGHPPFEDDASAKMYEKILCHDVTFPDSNINETKKNDNDKTESKENESDKTKTGSDAAAKKEAGATNSKASRAGLTTKFQHLITRLLDKKAYRRLGAGHSQTGAMQVKCHPWFAGLDWKKMLSMEIKPPYKPTIANNEDVSNFSDDYPDDIKSEQLMNDPDGTLYAWCKDF